MNIPALKFIELRYNVRSQCEKNIHGNDGNTHRYNLK